MPRLQSADFRVALLLAANFLMRLAAAATAVVVALYLARIDEFIRPVSALEVSLVVTISYTLIELPISPLIGAWSDLRGSRPFLLAGPLVGGLGVLLIALSTAPGVLVLGRALGGIGAVLTTPLMLKQLTAYTVHDSGHRSRMMTFFELTALVGFIAGSAVGGLAFEKLDSGAFLFLAGVYAFSTPLLWPRRIYTQEEAEQSVGHGHWQTHLRLFRLPHLRRFTPAWLAFNVVVGLWLSQIAFQLAGPTAPGQTLTGRFTDGQVGLLSAAYGVVVLLGLIIWAWILPRFRNTTAMLAGGAGMIGTSLAMLALNHLSGGGPIQVVWIVILAVSVMVETGFAPAALAMLGDISDLVQESRGALMGFYNVLLGTGQLVGGALGGLVAGWLAIDGIVWATVVLGLTSGYFVLALRPFERRSD